jgi:hypothetical protein
MGYVDTFGRGARAAGAFLELTLIHWVLWTEGLGGLREYLAVSSRPQSRNIGASLTKATTAANDAALLFPSQSTCLHRSALLVRILRTSGITKATLALGLRCEPYCGHAWVEVEGVSLNEEMTTVADFAVVDRL